LSNMPRILALLCEPARRPQGFRAWGLSASEVKRSAASHEGAKAPGIVSRVMVSPAEVDPYG